MLEAGPFWDPDQDWVSDEAGSHRLYWTEQRMIGGADPVELGKNNSGHGVGGSMVHYAGYTPRFHPSDFETRSRDGVGADWPIALRRPQASLRAGRARTAGRRAGLAVGRSAPLPARAASDRRRRRTRARGAPQARHRDARRPGRRSPTARSATGRTASTAASACRAARSTPRRRRWSRTCPTRIEHGVEIRADCMAVARRGRRRTGRCTGRRLPARRPRALPARPMRSRSPATRSRRRGCC